MDKILLVDNLDTGSTSKEIFYCGLSVPCLDHIAISGGKEQCTNSRLTTRLLRGALDMVTICTLLWSSCGCKHQVESEKGEHLSRTGWNGAGFVEVPKCDPTLSEISHFVPEWLATLPEKVLEGHIFMECTGKSKANDIDFKNKIF